MATPAQGPWQKRRSEKRRSPPPPTPNHDLEAKRQQPRRVYGSPPRSPQKTEEVERTSTSLSEACSGVYGRRPGRHPPPEYMEDAWRQPTECGCKKVRGTTNSRTHDGQRSYELAATRVRPTGRKMGSSDPRVQVAGGRRVSSEDAGVWAFKMSEFRM